MRLKHILCLCAEYVSCSSLPINTGARAPKGLRMEHETPDMGECQHCGDDLVAPNIEAWELTGSFICDACAEAAFEEISEDIE